jgi:GNAT superfamily N-acetyltransferase
MVPWASVKLDISYAVRGPLVGVRRSLYYEHSGSYGHILVLVVDQAWRGRRIGQHLVAEVERWLQGQGIQVVLVNSGTPRTEAHQFYHQQGYQTTGIRLVKVLPEPVSRPSEQ